jgi:putative ABC transport system permease protein
MLLNYLKIALRNIYKHPRHALFNIIGLSIGMAAAIIILSFILHELSYDDFHKKKDRIYRVIARVDVSEGKTLMAPMAHGYLKNWVEGEFPSLQSIIRLDAEASLFYYQDNIYRGNEGFYTDSSFFEAFTFRAKYGNPEKALVAPDNIILVEDMARRIFGEGNPVGEILEMKGDEFTVSAVLEEIPPNSHMDFDFLLPMIAKENPREEMGDRGISIFTYAFFKHPVEEAKVKKVGRLMEDTTNAHFEEMGLAVNHYLQPLEKAHMNSSGFQFNLTPPGSRKNLYTFSALALLIILIAVINYVNMETARSENRSREIGMRKVSGASRRALIGQFLGESVLLSFIALFLAFLLVEVFIPDIENLLQREFHPFVFEPGKILMYVGITFLIGLLAGFYPAIYLSGFKPVRILKGSTSGARKRSVLRELLVLVQFSIATFLIISLLFIGRQIHYLKNKDLGFDQEQVMVLRGITADIEDSYSAVRNELLTLAGVRDVSGAQSYPGSIGSHQQLRKDGESEAGSLVKHNRVQDHYARVLGIEIKQGRYFNRDRTTDSSHYVINEMAVEYLGLENPVGKEVLLNQQKGRIIGVMEDYHTESLQKEIMPLIHTRDRPRPQYLLLRVNPGQIAELKDQISMVLQSYDETYHMDQVFLDRYFDNLYDKQEKIHKLSMAGSGLAILIAILGLYALASFVVIKRTKEVGIRKAMGATGTKVALLINTSINKWVLLANVIAWPLSYYFITNWLNNFAYHIHLTLDPFIWGSVITLVIAILTVSYHTLLAARTNPAKTLREE